MPKTNSFQLFGFNSFSKDKIKQSCARHWDKLFFLLPIGLFIIFFVIHPFGRTFFDALKITSIHDRVNYKIGVSNFVSVINDLNFKNAFINSNLILLIGVPIGIILGLLFGLLLTTIMSQLFKNIIVFVLISQFFISSYVIGLSFIFLFDQSTNGFNLIFKTNTNWAKDNSLFVMLLFHIWRVLAFNAVIFLAHFVSQKKKYHKISIIDALTFVDQLKYVYFKSFQKIFLTVLYINIIEGLLLNPYAVFKPNVLIDNHIFSFSYYVYYNLLGVSEPQFGKVGAASVLIISYFSVYLLLIISYVLLKNFHHKIQMHLVGARHFLKSKLCWKN